MKTILKYLLFGALFCAVVAVVIGIGVIAYAAFLFVLFSPMWLIDGHYELIPFLVIILIMVGVIIKMNIDGVFKS